MLKKRKTPAPAAAVLEAKLLETRILLEDTECPLEEKLRAVHAVREDSTRASRHLDRLLVSEVARLRDGLRAAAEQQDRFRQLLEGGSEAPWLPAIFIEMTVTPGGPRAVVASDGTFRVVPVDKQLDATTLAVGDEIWLSKEAGTLTGRSSSPTLRCGDTAVVVRTLGDGRLVIKHRDEDVVVRTAATLSAVSPRAGDLVRWDRGAWMALEKVEHDRGGHLFLEQTPRESFDDIGGLKTQIDELRRVVGLHVFHSELVKKYRVQPRRSVLLEGPPGNGKTMMARALARWVGELSPGGRSRFMNIKPGALHSEWFGRSEANYREAFAVARRASADDPDVPIVMFFDEVDSIGGSRGASHMRVDDRVLTALMAELDGLERRGNILVVAATNRRDAIDPALLRPGRLGDTILRIGRPTMEATRDIFMCRLPVDVPYSSRRPGAIATGVHASATTADQASVRQDIIDAVVSHLYAPNGKGRMATAMLRDGSERPIAAADLMSGARIAKIATAATERACYREVETGVGGLCPEDLLSAADDELHTAVEGLTPANCHSHLADLPPDLDVVRVQPVRDAVSTAYRYLEIV